MRRIYGFFLRVFIAALIKEARKDQLLEADVVLGNDHVGRETMEYASDKWRPIPKGTLSDKIHDGITEFVKLQKGN